MTRVVVVVGDRPGQVDLSLLKVLLRRASTRAGTDVDVVDVVSVVDVVTVGEAMAGAWVTAGAGADGIVVDAERVRGSPIGDVSVPVVLVDLKSAVPEPMPQGRTIHGRGIETYVWATRHLMAWLRWPPTVIRYGAHPDQFGELRVPTGAGPHPVVVLIHGGFWRSHWELDLMDDLAIDLAGAGLAAWNIEYRRGPGSWEGALADVSTAIDHVLELAAEHGLDAQRTALIGHSAGGHLALWAAARGRHGRPAGARGGILEAALAVPLAPVSDLVECAARGLGEGAAVLFFGASPEAEPDRYAWADPMQRLPIGIPTTVVQGLADSADLIDLNRRFAARATSHGDHLELLELDGTDHFDVINAGSVAWGRVRSLLVDRLIGDRERHGRS